MRVILSNFNIGIKFNNLLFDKIGVLLDLKVILFNFGFYSDLIINDFMVFLDNVEKNEGKENLIFVFLGEEIKRIGDKNLIVIFLEEDLK